MPLPLVSAVCVYMQVVLVIVVKTWPARFPVEFLNVLIILTGLGWAGLYLAYLPYYHHGMNRLQVAMASVYLLAGVCLAIAQGYPKGDAAVAL